MSTDRFVTHAVENQPPALMPFDGWHGDIALRQALAANGAGWAAGAIAEYAKLAGGELSELGVTANQHRPQLRAFDRYGHRIDEVEYDASYHALMTRAMAHGVHAFAWQHAAKPAANVARAVLFYLHAQAEQGTCCPLTMTYASVPALRRQPRLAERWLPKVTSGTYDSRRLPIGEKAGALIGMGMTEKQGGSDVRANQTRALPVGSDGIGDVYELVGHKWFFSVPMSDGFLVLAQAPGGLSCFLLPGWLDDGRRNAIRIQRLKDKLGDWSNASSEVEFTGARAWRIGDEGRGVATILEMVALTRQDCMLGSAGIMRRALIEAIHHARHRSAFGRPLIAQPLMQNVLADLALESEAAMALSLRVARAVGASAQDPREAAFARVATALGKYWICKRCPPFVNEAQECLGGAGYVEESILPRLFRQSPLNSIWEGSGNIQCLDVLRALTREPASRDALFAELNAARGGHALLDAAIVDLERELDDTADMESRSRWIAERMALALQAALLVKGSTAGVADVFCNSRLGAHRGLAFGTLQAEGSIDTLIDRTLES